jgi:hypothetical protein
MVVAYLIMIVLLANRLLYATYFSNLTSDLGIVLIGLGLLYYFRRSRELNRLLNFFSLWVFLYITLVLIQAPIASFYYKQSVFDGIIGARDQFYYLSFPLFVLALNDAKKARNLMTALSATSVVIVFLAFIHNLGIYNVFIDRGGDEWRLGGERAGVIRFWFPGLNILILTSIWQFLRYLNDNRVLSPSLGTFAGIFAGVLMRQSRARIITLTAVLGLMAYRQRRYGLIAFAGFMLLIAVLVPTISTEHNIFVKAFETAYSDVAEGEGTWSAREKQIDIAKQVLRDTFWFGSGATALRGISHTMDWDEVNLKTIVYSADLGYWTWLKFYGFPGIVLLLLLIYAFVWYTFKKHRKSEWGQFVQLGVYHWLCVWVSLITLPYLTSPSGIMMICLSWALMVNGTWPTAPRAERESRK